MGASPDGGVDRWIDALFDLLVRRGAAHYDEAVSQLDHGLQAAWLATAAGAGDHLVVASLLHDVGYLVADELAEPDGDEPPGGLPHEQLGARWLGARLPPPVTAPVALHVEAKRYLVATDPGYARSLSFASRRSLVEQGGALDAPAATRFLSRPYARDAVLLRRWDDAAKVPRARRPGLDHYRPIVKQLARAHAGDPPSQPW